MTEPKLFRGRITRTLAEFVESFDDHCIYDHKTLAAEFEAERGVYPTWETQTVGEVRKTIRKRGIGGGCDGPSKQMAVSAVSIAEWCAKTYVPTADFRVLNKLIGMGSRFREAVRILKEAGV